MTPRFLQRRTIWWPTRWGWATVGLLALAPLLFWWFRGESFLASSQRLPADVLVVEGWISGEGIRASVLEFRLGDYRYVVATGGLTGERWSGKRWNLALEAEEQLLRSGIPRDQVILAGSRETESQRTYEMALSAWQALRDHHIQPKAINVFTRGAHARRSQLIFEKVFGRETEVGVISWIPAAPETERWWNSSERAEDMIKETVGYIFELLLSSGRDRNAPDRIIPQTGSTTPDNPSEKTKPVSRYSH